MTLEWVVFLNSVAIVGLGTAALIKDIREILERREERKRKKGDW